MKSGVLRPGKVPIGLLEKTVLRMTGASSKLEAVPPGAGLDFASVRVGREFLLVSADPITGVEHRIGDYAVQVTANDIATSGNRQQFAETVILLPEKSRPADLEEIAHQIHSAAERLGVTILGGHTEVTPGLRRPIVSVTGFSLVDAYVSSGGVRPGDTLMMTKTAGIEGTAVLASEGGLEGRLNPRELKRAGGFLSRISVVEEGVKAFGTGGVRAMHDCTEGGVLGAAFEMSVASGVGFELVERAVPVAAETRRICEALSLDPLRLIASGAMLMAVKPGEERKVAKALRSIAETTVIGSLGGTARVCARDGGKKEKLTEAPEDELWRVLRAAGRR
ncbi:MAG: hypothetical protein HY247_04240 [archaeon]|nr:MAG: hypothetical protein HY247_04240 [archaeon]